MVPLHHVGPTSFDLTAQPAIAAFLTDQAPAILKLALASLVERGDCDIANRVLHCAPRGQGTRTTARPAVVNLAIQVGQGSDTYSHTTTPAIRTACKRHNGSRSQLRPAMPTPKHHQQSVVQHTACVWLVVPPKLDASFKTSIADLPHEPSTTTFSFTRWHNPAHGALWIPARPRLPPSQPKHERLHGQRRLDKRTHASPAPHDARRNAPRTGKGARSCRQQTHPRAVRSSRPLRFRSIHCLQYSRVVSHTRRIPDRTHTSHIFTPSP